MKIKKGARLIVEYEEEYEEDFQIAMLRKNKIPHLLRMEVDGIGRKTRFSYQAEGMTSMALRFEKQPIREKDLREFLQQYEEAKAAVRDHMLLQDFLWLDPAYIYYREGIYWFAYLPVLKSKEREQFHKFTNFLVRKIDYRDVECIQLAHRLNRESMEETFSLSGYLGRYDQLAEQENWMVREEMAVFGSTKSRNSVAENGPGMQKAEGYGIQRGRESGYGVYDENGGVEEGKRRNGESEDKYDVRNDMRDERHEMGAYGNGMYGKEEYGYRTDTDEAVVKEGRFMDPLHKTWSRIRKRRWGRWQDLILESDGQEDESSL